MHESAALSLTERQLEFLALFANGHTIAEVADMKLFSRATVERDLRIAKTRTGAATPTHLVVMAIEAGMLRRNGDGYRPVLDQHVVGD